MVAVLVLGELAWFAVGAVRSKNAADAATPSLRALGKKLDKQTIKGAFLARVMGSSCQSVTFVLDGRFLVDDQTCQVHLDRAERNVERDGDMFLGLGGHVIDCRCLGRPVDGWNGDRPPVAGAGDVRFVCAHPSAPSSALAPVERGDCGPVPAMSPRCLALP